MKKALQKPYYRFLKLKNRIFHGRPVLVLMYHRISDVADVKTAHLTVNMTTFEKQLVHFKEKYQILRLTDEWSSLKKTGLVLTFDDGYADNYKNALPLLEKHNIPATIFVTTIHTDTQNEFWWDQLVVDYGNIGPQFYLPGIEEKVSKQEFTYQHCVDLVSKLDNQQKKEWFLAFEKANHIEYKSREEYRSLTLAELQKLDTHHLIDIGLHSHNHYSLGNLTEDEQMRELALSIKTLHELKAPPIKYLALPHGSYNMATAKVIKENGVLGMLLANNYYSNKKNKASGKINRILMPNIESKKLETYLKHFDFKI